VTGGGGRGAGALHGVLLVDKPPGRSSFSVVHEVRRATGVAKAGHAGTLDPMATGVLAVCVGEGTKAAAFLLREDKEYEAVVALGTRTDTDDADGAVVETVSPPAGLDLARVRAALAGFLGPQRQRPPQVSAIKVEGRRAYARARAGEEFELEERDVVVHALEATALELGPPVRVALRVRASKGFYVRSLARDLGGALGTVAHLAALRRTRAGAFEVGRALPLAEIVRRCQSGEPLPLLTCAEALAELPAVALDAEGAAGVRTGRPPRPAELRGAGSEPAPGDLMRLLDPEGELAAVVRIGAADALQRVELCRVFFARGTAAPA